MNRLALFMIIGALVILSACQNNPSSTSSEKEDLTITTSLYPLQYFGERIGGDVVEVSTLLPPGADAHTFEPTPKDMIAIAESDLFIYNGLGMESYSSKIAASLKDEETLMLEATNGVDVISASHDHEDEHGAAETGESDSDNNQHENREKAEFSGDSPGDDAHDEQGETTSDGEASHEEETHDRHSEDSSESDANTGEDHSGDEDKEHSHGDYDPHVWLDPKRSEKLAANIRDALIELRPEEKETFEKNYKDLQKDLDTLHHDFSKAVEGKEHPEILVSHAAYGYWEDTYGIEQLAVAGLSPTDEPSQRELKNIIVKAREHGFNYVIFEQNVTPRIAKIIQNEIKAKPLHIHNLSVLTEEDIEANDDYMSLMKENIETIRKAVEDQ
ncbi:metal ABC transporter solute-binding protein, Zn/Mn family [Rossellomorea sp. NS-SX7]|uniref:metal ABC transporter solute-binding protein, Zn/Mn family n=1 Tax=Rossellomorea sp. NS-SX7 TaxID=3463856 RepID=UPI0040593616